jgi:nucleotide-binding universal stress UspA family protein
MDLLVMGAYGHSQIREFIVGNTTTKLVRICPRADAYQDLMMSLR